MQPNKRINIAIDGHSSCGKGTLARYLATHLGYTFIDSGAMYRAVTLYVLRKNLALSDEDSIARELPNITMEFRPGADNGRSEMYLNGENVEAEIRQMAVAQAVSDVAKIPAVRRFLVALQQQMGKNKGVVMDGRDIGTVVFPDAELKIFMTASPEVRAIRRFNELIAEGIETDYEAVLKNIKTRDQIDSTRADSPLHMTAEYKLLDNSDLSIEAQNKLAISWADAVLHA